MTENTNAKPECQLVGTDGNAFAIIGNVAKALRKVGMVDEAAAWTDKAMQCGSYDELLQLAMGVVDVT